MGLGHYIKKATHVGHYISSGIDHALGEMNDWFGTDPGGPTGVPNDQGSGDVLSFSTDTMTGPENQRIQTTSYMENGGSDMFGSNTAYNEEQNNQGSWWDRNKDWIIPTLTTVGTTAAGMIYNNHQQNKTNQFNAEEAQKTRDFNLYMSNTAHQREMEDLVAAGLNPANTANGGQGAAGESGAQASGANPQYMGYGDMANTALSLAETMKALSENKYISAEKKAAIANTTADTLKKNAETGGVKATTDETKANTEKIKAETENIKEQFNLLSIQEQQMVMDYATAYANAQSEREKAEIEAKFYGTGFGKAMKYTGLTLSSLIPILGPIGRFATPHKSGGLTVNNVNY